LSLAPVEQPLRRTSDEEACNDADCGVHPFGVGVYVGPRYGYYGYGYRPYYYGGYYPYAYYPYWRRGWGY